MKIPAYAILALILATQIVTAQGNPTNAEARDAEAIKQITKLEEVRNQAILKGDAAAIERMTSEDYTFITLKGELRTKAEIVKGFASGAFHYQSRTISDLKIRVYRDAAVVTGRSIQKGTEDGKDYSGDYWFTRVYIKKDGTWTTVALQTTMIQQ